MAKPRFDPNIVKQIETSGGLQPIDFMRPAPQTEPEVKEEPLAIKAESKPEASSKLGDETSRPSLSPRRKSKARVLVPIRLLEETDERLKRFVQDNDLYLQDVVEVAIMEFLDNHSSDERDAKP